MAHDQPPPQPPVPGPRHNDPPPSVHSVLSAVRMFPSTEKRQVAVEAAKNLSQEDKQAVAQQAGWPAPSSRVSDRIWQIVIWTFAIVLVGSFLTLASSVFVTPAQGGTSTQTILTVFTTVVGFLSGLFVPSPVANRGSQANRQGQSDGAGRIGDDGGGR